MGPSVLLRSAPRLCRPRFASYWAGSARRVLLTQSGRVGGALIDPNELSRRHRKCGKPVIGVTGGIGAGKSTVAGILGSLGAAVISSDHLGHELLRDPQVLATLRRWWGESILTPNGDVHRGAVASIVFRDQAELARLESLLHPRIAARREALMEAYTADLSVKAIVLDTPKLYEAGVDALCDMVIFVDADQSACLRRLAESRGWTEEELNRRKKMQNPLDVKRTKADHVIVNNSGIGELRMQVERVFSTLVNYLA